MSSYKSQLQENLLSGNFSTGNFVSGFSYGRLGDCEISFILAKDGDPYHQRKARFTGLIDDHRERFIEALEGLTFLDLCLNQQFNKDYIDQVQLKKKTT